MKRLLAALLLCAAVLGGCAAPSAPSAAQAGVPAGPEAAEDMVLRYAEQFTVEREADGCLLVTIGGTDRFRLVSATAAAPDSPDAVVLRVPLKTIYVADSASMDLFARLGALDRVRLTSTKESDWRLEEVRRAMEDGGLLYAGKYSAPDYELLLSERAELALENTMLYHSPETKEQLEALGIPVLVGRMSYETHPLGRLEWIRLYGLLVGREAEAEAFFAGQAALAESVSARESTGKTVAFFSISANGAVSVRRSGDYIVRLIELAGGRYAFSGLVPEDGSARFAIDPEAFCAGAKDADVLIYNDTVGGGMETLEQLLALGEWLDGFRAVRNGDVWCTGQNLFQQTSSIAEVLEDLSAVLGGAPDEEALRCLRRLR